MMDEKETLFGTGFYPAAYPNIIRNSTATNKYRVMAGPSITNRSLFSMGLLHHRSKKPHRIPSLPDQQSFHHPLNRFEFS
jgi:hypothetical protein